jgi:hypothetical protein
MSQTVLTALSENARPEVEANASSRSLTGLPSGKTAKIQITAVNNAGQSEPSVGV